MLETVARGSSDDFRIPFQSLSYCHPFVSHPFVCLEFSVLAGEPSKAVGASQPPRICWKVATRCCCDEHLGIKNSCGLGPGGSPGFFVVP